MGDTHRILASGTIVQVHHAGYEQGEIVGVEHPWLPSGDDTPLYEVKLHDERTVFAVRGQLDVETTCATWWSD